MLKLINRVTARIAASSFLLMLALWPALAKAQEEAVKTVDNSPTPADEQSSWLAFLLAILLFAAICVGCFMTPKRTHQD